MKSILFVILFSIVSLVPVKKAEAGVNPLLLSCIPAGPQISYCFGSLLIMAGGWVIARNSTVSFGVGSQDLDIMNSENSASSDKERYEAQFKEYTSDVTKNESSAGWLYGFRGRLRQGGRYYANRLVRTFEECETIRERVFAAQEVGLTRTKTPDGSKVPGRFYISHLKLSTILLMGNGYQGSDVPFWDSVKDSSRFFGIEDVTSAIRVNVSASAEQKEEFFDNLIYNDIQILASVCIPANGSVFYGE